MPESSKRGNEEVQINRRWKQRRSEEQADVDQGVEEVATEFKPPRRKKQRRRQIDPTTCERDYNQEEIDFMQALDEYKRSSGRMFPTCSEILEVVRGLGYTKLTEDEQHILASINEVEEDLADCMVGDQELDELDIEQQEAIA